MPSLRLADVFSEAIRDLHASTKNSDETHDLPFVLFERDRCDGRADYSTSVALQLGKMLGLESRQVAERLVHSLSEHGDWCETSAREPGFITVRVSDDWLLQTAVTIAGQSESHFLCDLVYPFDMPGIEAVDQRAERLLRQYPMILAGLAPADLRYAILRHRQGSPPPTELRLARLDHSDNPCYAVTYAHSRAASILRYADSLAVGIEAPAQPRHEPSRHEREVLLLLANPPCGDGGAARELRVHAVTRHLEALAEAFSKFEAIHPVLPFGDDQLESAHRLRLKLVKAVRKVLADGLMSLHVPAPERM